MPPIVSITLGIAIYVGLKLLVNKHQNNIKQNQQVSSWLESLGLPEDSNANASLPDGTPLLIKATQSQFDHIAVSLLQNGANVNAMNAEGKTALFYASSKSFAEILIKSGALINARDIHGKTPIFYANSPELLSYLIAEGADVNISDNQGQTALFYARSRSMAQVLIKKNASVKVRDIHGKTPLFYAKSPDLLSYLIAHGADPNTIDNYNKDILDSFKYDDVYSDDIQQCVRILLQNAPSLKTAWLNRSGNLNRIIGKVSDLVNNDIQKAISANDIKSLELLLKESEHLDKINYNSLAKSAVKARQPECFSLISSHCSNGLFSVTSEIDEIMKDIKNSHDSSYRQRNLTLLKLILDYKARHDIYPDFTRDYETAVRTKDQDIIQLISRYVKTRKDQNKSFRSEKNARSLKVEKNAKSTAPCDQRSESSRKRKRH